MYEDQEDKEFNLVGYFISSKRVSVGYIAKKTNIPYGTVAYYVQDPERLEKASKRNIHELYEFITGQLGAKSPKDIDNIQRKEEYFVNNNSVKLD